MTDRRRRKLPVAGSFVRPTPEGESRADLLLVGRGLFESRARAQEAIAAGLVRADGVVVVRPSALLPSECEIVAEAPHPYVSRGGVKLAAALDAFGIDPADSVCLDVGASTGGFTEVLLGRGARMVYAVDVGRGQLHARLADDPRVVSIEATDIRELAPEQVPGGASLVVVDVSFISVRLILPRLMRHVNDAAELVVLVKPQFEVGRDGVGRGGIVRDPELRAGALRDVAAAVAACGFSALRTIPSPIAGRDGNEESLLGARRGG